MRPAPPIRSLLTVLSVLLVPLSAAHGADTVRGVKASHIADEWGARPTDNGDTDAPMYLDPYLSPYPVIKRFHPDLAALWLKALGRPDTETRRRTAADITKARGLSMPGLDAAAGPLLALVGTAEEHELVRKSAARALIALDHRASAAALLERNRADDLDTILLTDPALAAWDHEPARALWMARLTDPASSRTARISAIRALATVRHEAASEPLRLLMLDKRADPALRLAAGRALGTIVHERLETLAGSLADPPDARVLDRLLAASLLTGHSGDAAVSLLLRLAVDEEPTVAAVALRRLLEIDPLLIRPIGFGLLTNRDAKIRHLAAEGVFAQKSPESVTALGPLLNDRNPDNRIYVRRGLVAQDTIAGLAEPIRAAAVKQLSGPPWDELDEEGRARLEEYSGSELDEERRAELIEERRAELVAERRAEVVKADWRGHEQAAMLLGAVDHEPAASRLIKLLAYPRVEVRTAAGAALRRLAIPEKLAPMLAYATRAAAWQLDPGGTAQEDPLIGLGIERKLDVDEQMAQLIQAFGTMGYREAEPLMRRHVPKTKPVNLRFAPQARAAAIWSLGLLHRDEPVEDLAAELGARLNDTDIMDPESTEVKRMSAVTIGRMRAESQMGMLQNWYEMMRSSVDVGGATRWAIMRITGEALPELGPSYREESNFSLRPAYKVEDEDYLLVP